MVRLEWLPLEAINVSHRQRKKVAHSKVEKHRIAFENGNDIEPIDVVACSVDTHVRYRILGNGRHRFFGALESGASMIPCRIHSSRLEAW